MAKIRVGGLFSIALLSLLFFNSKSFAQETGKITADAIAQGEKERRQAVIDDVNNLISDAEKLAANGKFFEASEKCISAKTKLENLTGPFIDLKKRKLETFVKKLKYDWATKLERDAATAFLEKKYQECITLAKSASNICPEKQKSLDSLIARAKKYNDAVEFVDKTKLSAIDPENKIRKEDINLLIKEAEVFFKNSRYEQARDNLEKVLIKDPYNEKATLFLDRVYRKMYNIASQRREVEITERMSEVEWNWNQGILPTEAIKPKETGPIVKKTPKSGIFEKLQNIVFDKIEFEDASITAVVTYLMTRSKQLDPEGLGVGLSLQLSPAMQAAPPRVTMTFDNIPMYDTIRYLCQGASLKWRIEEKAVLIGDKDIDEMETRFFQVRAALISSISGGASDKEEKKDVIADKELFDQTQTFSKTTSGTTGTGAAGGSTATSTAASEALKQYFIDRGIPFEAGATIAYDRRSGKLIVKNIPESLRKLEHLLRDLDIQTPLVLIESKILELTQTDMEELGFDWTLWTDYSNSNTTAPRPAIATTQKILRSYANNENFNSTTTADRPDKLINNLQVLPNFGPDNAYNIALTVNAMNQSGRTEILSAPKVIATSGTTAIIRMVREEYYPTSWTEPEISVSTSTFSYTPAYPEFGDATDIGIRFEVTPTVSPNNYTITLHLHPEITSLTGWTTYPFQIVMTTGDTVTLSGRPVIMMPEITRRDIDTNVKVFDGETVVLGGMLKDKHAARDDRWPGLGEIPILGRLFASTFDRTQKTNLLMFVTTRLMNNDGVPVRPNALRGIPEFNR
ncbi:MAG: hypothetical protein A2017_16125 [Lentisphaerae bacterium GWF2_44_16]|nr:MAG: hypothetical protein A2017_16125 [Lentisphaerae bacterium GWF2_44_16]